MNAQEQRLFSVSSLDQVKTAAKPISLYEFGSTERVIRHIQKKFVQYFHNASPVLDIGCGRGIFLQLLAEAGIEGIGLDHSEEAATICRSKGFEVHQQEARAYLAQHRRPFGGIFCSHVIEHLGYAEALDLLRLCCDSLRPGGNLLIVTPNPLDICVMSEIFWLDPTHVRPYPTPLLRTMVESCGLQVNVEKHFVGHWSLIGRRRLLGYLLRKLVLGRYYGKPNALVLARKNGDLSQS
jgi:2-polyprenyl-3-methyl-5-hydroxy-6-metoxy-1,4-benzoquinol methylase